MKMIKIPMISDRQINDWMLNHIRKAVDCAIFQHEVDKLKMMYSKYKDLNPSDSERFEDIKYIDYIIADSRNDQMAEFIAEES